MEATWQAFPAHGEEDFGLISPATNRVIGAIKRIKTISSLILILKLLALGALGLLALLWVNLSGSSEGLSARLGVLIQPGLLLLASAIIGGVLAHRAGFPLPIINGPPWPSSNAVQSILIYGAVGGAFAGLLILKISLLGPYMLTGALPPITLYTPEYFALGALYGGLTEEIIFRFGLMTLIAWALLQATGQSADWVFLVAIALSALLFAAGHLPVVFATGQATAAIITYVLVLNSAAGLIYGWLYWRLGLEAAMVAHVSTHITMMLLALVTARVFGFQGG